MKPCEALNRNSSRQQQDLYHWCGKRRMDREGVSLVWMERRMDGEGVSLVWMDRRMDRDEVEKEGRDQTFRTLCSGSDNG